MTMLAEQPRRYSAEEYLRLEHEATERHELRDGQIIAMAGGSPSHSLVIANVIRELGNRLEGSPCRVYDSNLMVRIGSAERYSYPDATIICGEAQFDPTDPHRLTVTNPRVVVEVLSPSTELSDRGEKFRRYLRVPSLEEYVLVAQDKPRVETFLRQADGTWAFAWYEGLDAVAKLRSVGVDCSLARVYAGVTFAPEQPPRPVE